jgi:hypothetical protein
VKRTPIKHEFVEYVPGSLAPGILYVSIPYATAVHTCACGCGNKVVTPITPADWQLLYDGDSVSLTPSIGNWGFPCRSHYWIKHDEIRWGGAWNDEQVAAGRRQDQRDREAYFAGRLEVDAPPPVTVWVRTRRRLDRLRRWVRL